jgi:oligopeptide/dipeptide ABC transporter ATP-binding protein
VKYKAFRTELVALNYVNLDIMPSEIIAVVGESGCGKSTLGLSTIKLLPSPPALFESGTINFQGVDILSLEESKMSELRGTSIHMIFQEPMSSLDPVYTIGEQITESIEVREGRIRKKQFHNFDKFQSAKPPTIAENLADKTFGTLRVGKKHRGYNSEAIEALKDVKISDPERALDKYPHELSGGMAQRIMIARALIERPSILIADEPTSALDVTTQAQVLGLIRNLRDEIGSSILFITHDLAVAAQIADRVVVMYAGEIVEIAPVQEIFDQPQHPYTEALINCFPDKFRSDGKLDTVSGDFPDLRKPPSGCRFHPRCKYAFERCRIEHPSLKLVEARHSAACFLRE